MENATLVILVTFAIVFGISFVLWFSKILNDSHEKKKHDLQMEAMKKQHELHVSELKKAHMHRLIEIRKERGF